MAPRVKLSLFDYKKFQNFWEIVYDFWNEDKIQWRHLASNFFVGFALGQNQSFNERSIGGIPFVYNFESPLVTKIKVKSDRERKWH